MAKRKKRLVRKDTSGHSRKRKIKTRKTAKERRSEEIAQARKKNFYFDQGGGCNW